jgi:hypothetical protein
VAKTTRVGSLEVGQDLAFQQREWKVQRAAWVVALLVLVAGFAGLLGGGPLSQTEASSGPLALEYDRFARKRAPTELRARLEPEVTSEGEFSLWLSETYLDKVDVNRVLPEPIEMAAASDRVVFRFLAANPGEPAEITFALEPSEPGLVHGNVGLVNGQDVGFDQVIFP